MTTNDEMREEIKRLRETVDQLPTKADLSAFATKDDLARFATKEDLVRFATKEDLARFATKDDLVAFKDDIIKNFKLLSEDAKDSVKKAAEGYGATLEKIERELHDLNGKVDTRFADHVKVLANHNERISALEGS